MLELVALADFEVVEVVRRRDLDRAGALLGIGIFVRDDRDLAADERQLHLRAGFDERRIALILGMHGNAGVAQHRLGPRRGDDDVVLVVARHLLRQRIAEIVHVPARVFGEHLGQRLRIERLRPLAFAHLNVPCFSICTTSRSEIAVWNFGSQLTRRLSL